VSGVGDQRHRIGEQAVDELHGNETEIEADTHGEGHAEACGTMPMMVLMGLVRAFLMGLQICVHRE